MRTAVVLMFLVGCGRVGFDATADGGTNAGDGSITDGGNEDTGPTGPRWLKRLGPPNNIGIAGYCGEVVVVTSFNSTFSGDGVAGSGMGVLSSIYMRFAADGTVKDTRVFDAEFFCDLRLAIFSNDEIVLGGLTAGGAMPALGICSMSTTNQDPLLIRIDGSGNESLSSHWVASTTNAQLWTGARFGSGELLVGGIYSGELMTNMLLPSAQADPNAFVARPLAGNPASAVWSTPLLSSGVVFPGPISTVGTRGYMVGGFATDATLLGTALTNVGGIDTFVARIDEDGSSPFVKVIGSTANEPDFADDQSIAALASGGVAVTTRADADVTFDGQSFPASDGPFLLLVLDGSGALQYGKRLPADLRVVAFGDTLYAAFTVTSPIDVGGTLFTPEGADVLVVKLDAAGAPKGILGSVGGAGNQYATGLDVVASDAVAISGITNGAITFGSTMLTTGVDTRFIGVFGL